MPPRHWRLRIEDILGAIERIQRYTADQTLESLSENSLIADAVQLNFQIIGEASRHVPSDIQARHPNVPWADMRAMRNLIVHQYFGVSLTVIWDTVQQNLPPLIPQLRAILENEP